MSNELTYIHEDGEDQIDPPANLGFPELQAVALKGFAVYTMLTKQDWVNVVMAICVLRERHGYNALTQIKNEAFTRAFFNELGDFDIPFDVSLCKALNNIRRELILAG